MFDCQQRKKKEKQGSTTRLFNPCEHNQERHLSILKHQGLQKPFCVTEFSLWNVVGKDAAPSSTPDITEPANSTPNSASSFHPQTLPSFQFTFQSQPILAFFS